MRDLLAAVLLLLVALSARAIGSVPISTQGQTEVCYTDCGNPVGSGGAGWHVFVSQQATCSAWAGHLNAINYLGRNDWSWSGTSYSAYGCALVSVVYGSLNSSVFSRAGATGCPANSTATGAQCACNLGFRPSGASCVAHTCEATALGFTGGGYGPYSTQAGALASKALCDGDTSSGSYGCTFAGVPTGASGEGSYWYSSPVQFRATGTVCNGGGTTWPSAPAAESAPSAVASGPAPETPPNPCETGTCPGTVNGTQVCVPCSFVTPDIVETQRDGAGATTGTTTTTTQCAGGVCTTTTTTRNGAGATTGTTTTVQGLADFCARNPTYPGCTGAGAQAGGSASGSSGGGGSGGTGTGVGVGTGGLRTAGSRTISDAVTDFKNAAMGTPLMSAASSFFTISAGGSCPTWTLDAQPVIPSVVAIDFMCSSWAAAILLAARAVLVIVASWFAWRRMVE
jgi:hypothetical protein